MFPFRKWFQTPRKRKPIVNADRRRSNRIRVILEALEDRVNPSAVVTTDLLDYAPGSTALITATDFLPGTDITFQVLHVLDAGADGLFGTTDDTLDTLANATGSGHEPWTVTDGGPGDLDNAANGSVFTSWFVNPDDSLGATFTLSASGLSLDGTMVSATTMFTDAKASANLDQFANLDNDWVNGNLGGTKANYLEGESVPYRMLFDNLSTSGTHTVTIAWDTTKDGKHALDYITSYNLSESPDPLEGVGDLGSHPLDTEPIPLDPNVLGAGVTQIPGLFSLFGGTITAVSAYTFIPPIDPYTGTSTTQITITFTASVDNPVLAWGGHIATRLDWGSDSSAVAISGSPFHTRLVALDGGGGNQDKSLSSDAVIFPGSITIIKDAFPDSSQDFSFTITGGLSPSSFLLDDDSDPTLSNTMLFSTITTFTTFTVTEASTPNWLLDSITSSSSSGNGGTVTFNLGAGTATITLKEGENVTVTFKNKEDAPPTITIVKTVDANEDGTFSDSEAVLEGGVGDQKVDYKFTISNTSLASTDPVTITSLVDDKLGDLLAIFTAANGGAVIPFGKSFTFFVNDFTVPIQNAGTSYTNLVTANGKDDENTTTNQATADAVVTFAPVDPTITIVKSVDADENGTFSDSESVAEGGVGDQFVDYKFTISNSSPASTDPVTITSLVDDKLGNLLAIFTTANGGSDTILVGGSVTFFVNDFKVPVGNVGDSYTNLVTANGKDDENTSTNQATADAVVTYTDVLPLIHVEKSADPLSVSEGGVGNQTITFTYFVTNTSPAGAFDPLHSVSLSDTDGTPTLVSGDDGDNILELGETWIYSLVTTAPTQNAGTDHTNTASVSGLDDESNLAEDTDTATITYTDVLPAILVEKSADPLSVSEGGVGDQTVTYTYLVTNTSLAGIFDPLHNVTLSDTDGVPSFVSGDDGDNLLELGETWIYSLVTTAPIQNAGTDHTNTASVSGLDDESNLAEDTDTATITYTDVLPLIHVEKSADPLSVPEGTAGQTVTYTYLVTNTSLAGVFDPLHSVSLSDTDGTPTFVSGDDGDNLLELGETWVYTLVTTAPIQNAGTSHTNTASVSGLDDENNLAEDTDTATITYENANVAAGMPVEKKVDADGDGIFNDIESVLEGGVGDQTVNYRFVITNDTPIVTDPLTITSVIDNKLGDLYAGALAAYQITHPGATEIVLEAGESLTFYIYDFEVPPANASDSDPLTLDTYINNVQVLGHDDDGVPYQTEDIAEVTYLNVDPSINVTKTPDQTSVVIGKVVTYTYLVTNNSPAGTYDPLSDVVLVDDDGAPTYISGDTNDNLLLEKGETWTYILTVEMKNLGPHTNKVLATGTDDELNQALDDASATVRVVGEQQDGKTLGYYSNKNGRYDLTGSFNGSALRDEIYTVLFAPNTGLLAKDGTFSVLVSANGNYIPLSNFHSFAFIKNFLLTAKAKNMAHMLSAQLLTTEFNVVLGRVDATRCIFVSLVPLSSAGVASISPLLNPDGTITVQAILDAAIATLKTNPNTVATGDVRIYQDALKSMLDAINNNGSIFVPCPPTP